MIAVNPDTGPYGSKAVLKSESSLYTRNSTYRRFNKVINKGINGVSWKIIDPGPGVGFGASAGGVVSTIWWYHREGYIWLQLVKGLQVNEFRLVLISKCFHFFPQY